MSMGKNTHPEWLGMTPHVLFSGSVKGQVVPLDINM